MLEEEHKFKSIAAIYQYIWKHNRANGAPETWISNIKCDIYYLKANT